MNFPAVATPQAAQRLVLATVNNAAVHDGSGNPNPEGDAPIGAATGSPGPDLTVVTLRREGDAFHATYTFDEPVTLQAGSAGRPAGQTLFYLFSSLGARLTSTACTLASGTAPKQVTCTAFTTTSGAAATSAQIGAAALGTVDAAAVFGSAGTAADDVDRNREGARPTVGGTA